MKNKGQISIIVLLVSAVMLTLGMSMSKQESVQIKINTNDELLKKAFDAAESGINYYLGTGATNYSSPDSNSFADINTTKISEGSDTIDFGEFVPAGNSESYWLVNHLDTGELGTNYYTGASVNVCSNNYSGNVKVDYFYKIGDSFKLRRYVKSISSNCASINIIGNPILLSITPLADVGGKFYIKSDDSGSTFASQGFDLSSEGRAGGTEAGANFQASKKLTIRQRYLMPGFLISGLMADGSVSNK
jgi:hypothetical protein